MGYWSWYNTGDGNPERTKMLKEIEGKDPSEMTEEQLLFYRNEQAKRQEKLERDAARMKQEQEERIEAYDRWMGLD